MAKKVTKATEEADKKTFINKLDNWLKNNKTSNGFTTSNYRDFMIQLAGVESTWRVNAENGSHKGLFQIENLTDYLNNYESQFSAFFKHLGKLKTQGVVVQEDFTKGIEKGYTNDQVLGMAWNQGGKMSNFIHFDEDSKDGNGTSLKLYADKIGKTLNSSFSNDFDSAIPSTKNLPLNLESNYASNVVRKIRSHKVYDIFKVDTIDGKPVGRFTDTSLIDIQKSKGVKRNVIDALMGTSRFKNIPNSVKQETYKKYGVENNRYFQPHDSLILVPPKINRNVSVHPDHKGVISLNSNTFSKGLFRTGGRAVKIPYTVNDDFIINDFSKRYSQNENENIDITKTNVEDILHNTKRYYLEHNYEQAAYYPEGNFIIMGNTHGRHDEILAHEITHAIDHSGKLPLSNNSKNKLTKAYSLLPKLKETYSNRLDNTIVEQERRAVNSEIRRNLYDKYINHQMSNFNTISFDDYIKSLRDEELIDVLKQTSYISSEDYNSSEKINNIKTAILEVAKYKNNVNMKNIIRFGGMIPSRKKFDYGGISAPGYTSYGSVAKASDVDSSLTSANGEGIIGEQVMNYGTMGLGLGATVGGIGSAIAGGAAAGSVVPGLGTLIGAGVGALIGVIGGIFGGRKKKRREERRRAEAIAQQQEAGRQAIIGNMESKEESDVAQLRQSAMNTSESTSFYTKFGGMIPHRKLFGNGGQIIQNSSNTAMAYGPSHENGGIAYGENAEIEGGEAIRQTPIGDQIYSDKLFIPGTRRTFADDAQILSEIKGMKEQEVQSRGSRILGKLEQLDRTRVNKLKMGTLMRNIEKDAFYMDKSAGQVVVLDKKLNDLFNTQEAVALVKGLRGNPQIARMGGCIRKKYPYGGIDFGGVSGPKPTTLSKIQISTTTPNGVNAFNNLNLAGLGINVLGTGLGMISNALSARIARKSLDWQMRNLTPAKRAKLIAPRYSTDYNINSDLQDIATQERRVAQYIKSNTSNPILARNLITKAAIDNLALRNKLYSQKRDYQTQRWDANINARIQTDNQNRQNDYLDQIDLRNHNMQYLGAIGNVQMQRAANFNAYLGDLATAGHQYLSARAYSTLWPTGVQRTMNTGFRCGGLIKGRRK